MTTQGVIFRTWRNELSLTQDELSQTLGIAQSTISAVERGQFTLSIGLAKRFALLAGKSWPELYPCVEGAGEETEEESRPVTEANL